MSEPLNNTKTGRRTYTAGGTIAVGAGLIISAARTVTVPTSGTRPVFVALSSAVSGEEVDVYPLIPGEEIRVRCNGNITAGTSVEWILSGGDAGKVQTLASGTPVAVALESAADEGLVAIVPIGNA